MGHFLYCITLYLHTGEQTVLGCNDTYDQMITTMTMDPLNVIDSIGRQTTSIP